MSDPDGFEITVNGALVTGGIRRAGRSGRRSPLVMLCAPLPVEPDPASFVALHDQITEALIDGSIAVATYQPRPAQGGDGELPAPAALVDDASAVFRHLLQDEGVDRDRVSLMGYSTAAIVAAGLAARAPRFLAGLCLLAPATPAAIREMSGGPDEDRPERDESATNGSLGAGDVGPADDASGVRSFLDALDELDPIADASRHDRPTLIVHGAADRRFEPAIGLAYHRRLEAGGRQSRFVLVPRGDHAFTEIEARVACAEQLQTFFRAVSAPAQAGGG